MAIPECMAVERLSSHLVSEMNARHYIDRF